MRSLNEFVREEVSPKGTKPRQYGVQPPVMRLSEDEVVIDEWLGKNGEVIWKILRFPNELPRDLLLRHFRQRSVSMESIKSMYDMLDILEGKPKGTSQKLLVA